MTNFENPLYQSCSMSYTDAAKAIMEADILLFTMGAGMSADSGLATFVTVAETPVYKSQNLNYVDISQPHWIHDNPALFYGFWGTCYNDYKDHPPHVGYQMMTKWKEKFLSGKGKDTVHELLQKYKDASELARSDEEKWFPSYLPVPDTSTEYRFPAESNQLFIPGQLAPASSSVCAPSSNSSSSSSSASPPSKASGSDLTPSAFFCHTSNVDSFASTSGLVRPHEVYECHGNILKWQCSAKCKDYYWSIPSNFRFEVDRSTMLAQQGEPCVLHDVRTKGSLEKAKTITRPATEAEREEMRPYGFHHNIPECIFCGKMSRPSILMFEDFDWVWENQQEARYRLWKKAVHLYLKAHADKKLVIVEVGCGIRVPTIRAQNEGYVDMFPTQTTLIRINPDYPFCQSKVMKDISKIQSRMVSLKTSGLVGLREIHSELIKAAWISE